MTTNHTACIAVLSWLLGAGASSGSAWGQDRPEKEQPFEKSGQRLTCQVSIVGEKVVGAGQSLKVSVEFASPDGRNWLLFNPWLNNITHQPGRLAVYEKESNRYVKDLLRINRPISWRFPTESDWVTLPGNASLRREFEFSVAVDSSTPTEEHPPLPPGTYVVQFIGHSRLMFPSPGNGEVASPEFKEAWEKPVKIPDMIRSNQVEFTVGEPK